MLKKTLVGATVAALALITVGTGSALAASPPASAAGTLHCSMIGKTKLDPPYLFTGSSPATATQKVKFTNCTGTSGVTSGKGTIVSHTTNNCVAPATGATATFKWKGAAKYVTSTVQFLPSMVVSGTFITTTTLSSSISGSFQGESATHFSVTDQDVATFIAACSPKTKGVKGSGGLKKESYLGVHGPSTFDIS